MSFSLPTQIENENDIEWPRAAEVDRAAVFLDESLPRLEARIEEVCADLSTHIAGLERVLASAVGTQGRGGRRWRPMLTLAAAEVFSAAKGPMGAEDYARLLDVAVAVELTHTASLVLDDMPCMDDSPDRRGLPATHKLVGSAGAILVSVGLLARSAELLGKSGPFGGVFCAEWGETVGLAGMSGGQAMDVAASNARLVGRERRLHRAKSTVLPAFALSSGARLAGASDASCQGLASFGRSLGWAYQLRDDVEDAQEDARLGKQPGGRRPLAQSQRIMSRALRRLRRVPDLSANGSHLLVGLSNRLVLSGSLEALIEARPDGERDARAIAPRRSLQ